MEEIKKRGMIHMDIWRKQKENFKWGYKEKIKVVGTVRSQNSTTIQAEESNASFFADVLLVF